MDVLKKNEIKAAFAIFEDVPLGKIDLLRLPRVPIPSHQAKWEFKLKVSWAFYIFVALRKWERKIKRRIRR